MEVSARARELERLYQSRRGHVPQISITDDNHHATEAIADMYGDDGYNRQESRPLSFVTSAFNESVESNRSYHDNPISSPSPATHKRNPSSEKWPKHSNGSPVMPFNSSPPFGHDSGPLSSSSLTRSPSDTATQQFPLNDIDYESSPAAVAQELSNLQAIRRMSMDVSAADPDLPSFSQTYGIPTVAPSHTADENDTSRLFWVPARLHPELAPMEFKTFLEDRVTRIRRTSGGEDTLLSDGIERQGSGGALRRKKSMLSRQIDGPVGYKDGAERLGRKRSAGRSQPESTVSTLQQLENIVSDPSALMRKLSIQAGRGSLDSGPGLLITEDMPILPAAPAGQALKRSTRTQYRKGSLRRGDLGSFARRGVGRRTGQDEDDPSVAPAPIGEPPPKSLSRVQTEPIAARLLPRDPVYPATPDKARPPPALNHSASNEELLRQPKITRSLEQLQQTSLSQTPLSSRIAPNGRTAAPVSANNISTIQTQGSSHSSQNAASSNSQLQQRSSLEKQPPAPHVNHRLPGSRSSFEQPLHVPQSSVASQASSAALSSTRPPLSRHNLHSRSSNQTFDDLTSHPSPLPGNSSHTADLTVVPTFSEDRKPEKKSKERKDGSESGTRKTSWGWLLGGDDKDKEKDKEKERRKEQEEKEKERAKKVRAKLTKPNERAYDSTRLDLLQTSIDAAKPRESLVLDRESVNLDEEKMKDSGRKVSSEKKEKESGLFSSLFGGTKKKGEREVAGKRSSSHRSLAPEVPRRIPKPDIDYNWTRFSILEERAIYRMAHIKLANPRRALYSQVLLSNFMYSYLAKVQQMHPQLQLAQAPTQKQKHVQNDQQQQQQQQHQQQQQQRNTDPQTQQQHPDEFYHYQRYHEQEARSEVVDTQQSLPASSNRTYFDDSDLTRYQEDGSGSDSRTSDQSAGSLQASSHSSYGNTNGVGYSVASGANYLGLPGGLGKNGPPYISHALFDDTRQHRDDEMW